MDKLEKSEKIGGKKVSIILIFDDYNKRKYKGDFQEFLDYQQGRTEEEEGETDWRIYRNIKEFKEISYEIFREYCISLFSKVMFSLVKSNPQFIVSDELNIQIKILRVKNRDYYFYFKEEACDTENACFDGAGSWFIQNIVAPYFYFGNVNTTHINRFFLHELTHFLDASQKYTPGSKYTAFELNYQKKIKKIARKKSAYNLNFLYNSLFALREEGIADLVARKDSPFLDISLNGIKEYNKNMKRLVQMPKYHEAEEFYGQKISWGNLTPSGEYSNGRYMCMFIALALAKTKKISYGVEVKGKKFYGHEFDFDVLFSKSEKLLISNLPDDLIKEAIKIIMPTAHYYFVKLYEKACDTLGISEKNRIMTSRRFYSLKEKAIKYAKAQRRKRLKKNGFVDDGSEIE